MNKSHLRQEHSLNIICAARAGLQPYAGHEYHRRPTAQGGDEASSPTPCGRQILQRHPAWPGTQGVSASTEVLLHNQDPLQTSGR